MFNWNYGNYINTPKHFVDIKILCKISFIVLTMGWAEKLLQIYKYLL